MKAGFLCDRCRSVPLRCRIARFVRTLALALLPMGLARPTVGQTSDRFVWVPRRLREVATIDNRLSQTQQLVLLKLDTATGRVWLYDPDSLTLAVEDQKDDDGHFRSIEVEGLPPWPPPEPKPERGKKTVAEPPKPTNGRYGFSVLALPRTVRDATGERRGVTERDELFLTDNHTGHNWIFRTVPRRTKGKEREITLWHNRFTRLFNADDIALAEDDPRAKPPEKTPHQLLRSAAEWLELFLAHREGKTLHTRHVPSIDVVIILSKDDTFTPLVVMRPNLKGKRVVGVSPWQTELYSNAAVDYLCLQEPVPFAEADRYAIFIASATHSARGFNPLQTHMIGGIPDHSQIGKLLRVE